MALDIFPAFDVFFAMPLRSPRALSCVAAAWLALCSSSHAIILFGLDNSANQTDPGTGVPFASVARVFNGSTLGGSAVYLGNRWMLTANHVGPFNSVTFDGTNNYSWDGVAPIQIGTTDMKLFRLTATPNVSAAALYAGNSELTAPATLVGWGVGRDPNVPVDSDVVGWGGSSTSEKRWGLNEPMGFINVTSGGHTYQAVYTVLGSGSGTPPGLGANEAAATLLDSGSGLFQQFGGDWYLTGLAAAVQTSGTSNFGNNQINEPRGDRNFFVRISQYETEIAAIIPEPGTAIFGVIALLVCTLRRRRGR